ncbi:hypothetical protein [Paraburkholderia bryophila]|uniref:Uncharacterized protein n=1 Tax=Paraburkholderia bryophila TaxID=420952 RepID=A0A7Y9WL21_9BURK|nr:hypothetical protein [Paraburkholderia bryophila]NYH22885.1 hypothetical protein [Paraburkholderia bryophila]
MQAGFDTALAREVKVSERSAPSWLDVNGVVTYVYMEVSTAVGLNAAVIDNNNYLMVGVQTTAPQY